jgi:hypothetical protein
MKYQTPEAHKLAEMLSMILGSDATAKVAPAITGSPPEYVATYIDNEKVVVATCSCALPTAAALGCALSMIPPGGAEAMVEDKEISKMASDNFYEVMNIFSSLLMNDKSAHLKLAEVVQDSGTRLQADGGEEMVFTLGLGKYGTGEVVFNYT